MLDILDQPQYTGAGPTIPRVINCIYDTQGWIQAVWSYVCCGGRLNTDLFEMGFYLEKSR